VSVNTLRGAMDGLILEGIVLRNGSGAPGTFTYCFGPKILDLGSSDSGANVNSAGFACPTPLKSQNLHGSSNIENEKSPIKSGNPGKKNVGSHADSAVPLLYNSLQLYSLGGSQGGLTRRQTITARDKAIRIVSEYNRIAGMHGFRKANLTNPLLQKIYRRLHDFPAWKTWVEMFAKLEQSPHLKESWFSLVYIVKSSETFENVKSGWLDWRKKTRATPANEDEIRRRARGGEQL
jgi:hypothetical protein